MPRPVDVLAAIDRLYQAPLERFVAERDQLVKELRAAGNREAAASVKSLAKPSATAWAVNRAWWAEEAAFREMLAAGEALRTTQEAALRGKLVDLRAAITTRQRAVDAVAEMAMGALGSGDEISQDARRRIVNTLETIATGGWPSGVRPGRLTGDLSATGFDVLSALAASLPSGAEPRPGRSAPSRQPPTPRGAAPAGEEATETREDNARARKEAAERRRREEAAAAREEAERAIAAASRAAADADRAEEKARRVFDAAAARVTEVEEDLSRARQALAQARTVLAAAEKETARAEAEVRRARK